MRLVNVRCILSTSMTPKGEYRARLLATMCRIVVASGNHPA